MNHLTFSSFFLFSIGLLSARLVRGVVSALESSLGAETVSVLPLYGSLPHADQQRALQPPPVVSEAEVQSNT